jgi:hypothetical protein
MEFNIKKFLVKNKLTKRSTLNENDNTGGMLKTDAEQDEMNDDEMFGDEESEDNWFKDDSDDSAEFEKEPSAKDVKSNEPVSSGIHKKQAELKALEHQKDALLMQLKSNIISIDQYKAAISNIPAQIKKLRADIEKATNVTLDDEDAEL